MEAVKLVLDAEQKAMVSDRSGETCTSVISDLVVSIGALYNWVDGARREDPEVYAGASDIRPPEGTRHA